MHRAEQPLVDDVKHRHPGSLVDAAALRVDDPILDLVAHPQPMASTDRVQLSEALECRPKLRAVHGDRHAARELHADLLGRNYLLAAPVGHSHDGLDDLHVLIEPLEILGLVRSPQHVRIRRIRPFGVANQLTSIKVPIRVT